MCQSDQLFIDIFYHFQTTSQSQGDVDFRNHHCLCTPPNDSKFSFLYYINDARFRHKYTFVQREGDVYIFCTQDQHHDTCPKLFHL